MKFSVLLSVYAQENPEHLESALCSIWDQQTLKPSEIVLVKDGALTSELEEVIERWTIGLGDTLTLVELLENLGLAGALNAGLRACRHELVARMDTDDVSTPERFEKQVAFMDAHKTITASSAQLEEWDETMSQCNGTRRLPLNHDKLAVFAKRRSPLSHPVSIYRKSDILAVGGYPNFRRFQDWALWSLLVRKGYRLSNLPDTLLRMRAGDLLFARRGRRYFRNEAELLRFQHEIGLVGFWGFRLNYLAKFLLRHSPVFMRKLAYKFAR
jgi:glycosyltransferase involved in cell wall biosynthesis